MLKVLMLLMKAQAEEIIAVEQAEFRAERSTTEQNFNLRILCEKYFQHQQNLYHVFIDFKNDFDRVWHEALWASIRKYNISANLIRTTEQLYDKATSAELEKRTQAFEMNCCRRLLNISYKDHVTNEEVRRKIKAAIGEYDELLTLVKKRKLRWFGHVSRCSGLAKTILQRTMKRKRGRQKKRWEGNIKEWTEMDLASSARAAENRTR